MVQRSYRLKGSQPLLKRTAEELGYVREIEGAYYAINIIEENRLFLQGAGIETISVTRRNSTDTRRLRELAGAR